MTSSKVVVVTGTSGAIGGAVAQDLTGEGWRVIGVDAQPSSDSSPLVEEIVGDVSQAETWDRVAASVAASGEGLDGLVHSAAVQICGPLQKVAEGDWDRLMTVNLKALYLAGRVLHAPLARSKGAIVGIGSVHAVATSTNIAAYAASKGALSAMLRALAVEWAKDGIRVNTVLPGAIDSEMLRAGLMRGHLQKGGVEQRLAELASRTALGRVGQPGDVAGMVQFLLDSSLSSFVTGSEFIVDGGALAQLSTE